MWKIQCFDKNGDVLFEEETAFVTPHDVIAFSMNQEAIQKSSRIELVRVEAAE